MILITTGQLSSRSDIYSSLTVLVMTGLVKTGLQIPGPSYDWLV